MQQRELGQRGVNSPVRTRVTALHNANSGLYGVFLNKYDIEIITNGNYIMNAVIMH